MLHSRTLRTTQSNHNRKATDMTDTNTTSSNADARTKLQDRIRNALEAMLALWGDDVGKFTTETLATFAAVIGQPDWEAPKNTRNRVVDWRAAKLADNATAELEAKLVGDIEKAIAADNEHGKKKTKTDTKGDNELGKALLAANLEDVAATTLTLIAPNDKFEYYQLTINGEERQPEDDIYAIINDGNMWMPTTEKHVRRRLAEEANIPPHQIAQHLDALQRRTMAFPHEPWKNPPENFTQNINLETGDILEDTAFRDSRISINGEGEIAILPHDRKYLYRNIIPRDLPNLHDWATLPKPIWDDFLADYCLSAARRNPALNTEEEIYTEADAIAKMIYTMIGACLFDNRLQKLWVLFGPGRSGKSVITKIITAIVGKRNTKSITDLNTLGGNFLTANMRAVLVIFLNEMQSRPHQANAVAKYDLAMRTLKSISGGDDIAMEIKQVQYTPDSPITANIIATTNNLTCFPSATEETGSWEGRLEIIPSGESIDEAHQDETLPARITATCLDGITAEAAMCYAEAVRNGVIPKSHSSERLLEIALTSEWLEFTQRFEYDPGNWVGNSTIKHELAEYLDLPEDRHPSKGILTGARNALITHLHAHNALTRYNPDIGKKEGGLEHIRLKPDH